MTVSDAEIKAILDEVDKDKSGTIDYKEFCEMMAKSALSKFGQRHENTVGPSKPLITFFASSLQIKLAH